MAELGNRRVLERVEEKDKIGILTFNRLTREVQWWPEWFQLF